MRGAFISLLVALAIAGLSLASLLGLQLVTALYDLGMLKP